MSKKTHLVSFVLLASLFGCGPEEGSPCRIVERDFEGLETTLPQGSWEWRATNVDETTTRWVRFSSDGRVLYLVGPDDGTCRDDLDQGETWSVEDGNLRTEDANGRVAVIEVVSTSPEMIELSREDLGPQTLIPLECELCGEP